ncbi:glycosyltransferase family 4 protein [Shewanella benthica]|uniref:Putative glycosyltransferase n=1 Tax=Shewanella benthica KT99 TaxID=314608 RepID=A9D4I6_9GAMM|nr:glycosyltransferase family 4 protein [Shewanella benthica]EDQ01563.1 putative glycosyltransferase [Shewanella benthica KT99]
MKKTKLLCILHRSPPMHGAAQVGDFIASSDKLKSNFDCKYITIKSSNTIADIGKISIKKIYYIVELYFKIFFALITFRPDKIYFTASVRGIAFYRDLLLSSLWKLYQLFTTVDVYYHYHTKGVDEFVTVCDRNLKLTNIFLKKVNLILLTPMLRGDFEKVNSFHKVLYLPNGVDSISDDNEIDLMLESKFNKPRKLNLLYLSNMIKSKGYYHVLELAKKKNDKSIQYHFAGGWQTKEDEKLFFNFIENNNLSENVTFHGFVNGSEKAELLQQASLLIFPTRYRFESFGLVVIEALSYGVPVIATDEGSIPFILDESCGVIIDDTDKLSEALEQAEHNLLNKETALYCRQRYLNNFSLEQFEINLIEVLK